MPTLPTSLRRTMFILLAAMSMILMVFYWNQSALKPMSFVNGFFDKSIKHNPPENTWTYKCLNDKCVRQHYFPLENSRMIGENSKRKPFMTCAMTCGVPKIWPMPTGNTILSKTSQTFTTDSINLNIVTKYSEVDSLLKDAFAIFMNDLNNMAKKSSDSSTQDSNHDTLSANSDDKSRRANVASSSSSSSSSSSGISPNNIKDRTKKNCDIKNFNIKIIVNKISGIHLHMEMDESYNISVSNSNDNSATTLIRIHAKSFFGARHALITLQQLIWYDDEDNLLRILSTAQIVDEPKFHYRGIMLDTSRHYFSIDAIKRTLVGMSHSKLNRFHWHMTDSQSFPYMSKHYPQLAKYGAYSSREIYTMDDVREIVEFARPRGIQIIPEIDAPAHSGNGWDWGTKHGLGELSLCINQQPWSFYCGEPPCGQLNPKNNNTYMILQKLYGELLELTGPTDYFHLGGDEVNLDCWAQYFNDTDLRGLWCDFMLQAFGRLKLANNNMAPRIVSVWSSGLTNSPCLSRHNFAVQVWGGSTWQENYDLLMNGYSVIISHVDAWYLDCGFGNWRATGDGACSPYTTWQKVYKHRPWDRMRLDTVQIKQILGGEACLWTEQVDENSLDSRLWPRSGALAERLWSDPPNTDNIDNEISKSVFNRMSIYRNNLVALGLKAEPLFPKYCAQNQEECD